MFLHPLDDSSSTSTDPFFDAKCKAIITNVKSFFEQLKARLGKECAGTIFNAPTQLTAIACGVSTNVVSKLKVIEGVLQPIPSTSSAVQRTRKHRRRAALEKHGDEWGDRVRRLIHEKLGDEFNITVAELWTEMGETYPDFVLAQTTFYYLLRGMGFSYRKLDGQRIIFESRDIVTKRAKYLEAVETRCQTQCSV
ncbi:unnamed protein product [Cylicostephanus goldi]|uniref:Uncharacterized protein n=1 Tax=Cylicostephanus goldi TaxID=71465 RepID=A0A3P6RAU4_CYLGO|nr:unnamed protein product [Cylicostephanus goldi]